MYLLSLKTAAQLFCTTGQHFGQNSVNANDFEYLMLHCEKSLFVLASRKTIPSLRTQKSCCQYQNNLPVAHRVFNNPTYQKNTSGKSRPVTTDTPENPSK
jgi:hypothetical protein